MTWLVSIEERSDPGSPYYTVATDVQAEVERLEQLASKAGLNATVRHADTFATTVDFLERNTPKS
jgi:hypothetical protein